MKYDFSFRLMAKALVVTIGLLLVSPPLLAQELTNPPVAQTNVAPEQDMYQDLLRSFLHLQEQLHTTQLVVERSRTESENAAARNNEAVNARLQAIESMIEKAAAENTAALVESNRRIQESNTRILLLAGIFAVSVLLVLALTGWMQWRTVAHFTTNQAVGFPALLPRGYGSVSPGAPGHMANVRLMDALGRLENRIAEIEGGSQGTRSLNAVTVAPASLNPASQSSSENTELVDLLREGEELLSHEEAEKAIEHFDSVLKKHPGNPKVLLHKGAALERLHRDQEAIDCYDLAIRADKNLTMAYLHKGGLFNRMERFSEAMECYEQALRIQEGRRDE